MLNVPLIQEGAGLLASWLTPLLIFGGMLLGLVIGVIPGMTAALGLAVILPLTFSMDALNALVLMTSVYTGSLTGGGILAILINTPGTPGAAATTFDGYPMAKQGRQNEALGLQIAGSVIGGLFGYLVLLALIQPMARFALMFGTPEMLFLTVFVILMVATLQSTSYVRTVFAGILGLLLSTIGTSAMTGEPRGTFGLAALEDGLPIVLCVIGMFAVPELMNIVARERIAEKLEAGANDMGRLVRGVGDALRMPIVWARGSLIGILIGMLPAAGAAIASLLSYSTTARGAQPNQRFGEGEPSGVVAAESANNASEGGSMAVLMALGIPGSASTAVILGGFMLHGLVPGPRLFTDNGALVYGLILANIAQMALLGFCALGVAYFVARIVVVPSRILVPALIVLLAVGAFSFRNNFADIAITFAFGGIGFVFRRHQFALIALMLGLFLGQQIDDDITRFVILYGDDPLSLLERPLTVVLALASMVLLGWQLRQAFRTTPDPEPA